MQERSSGEFVQLESITQEGMDRAIPDRKNQGITLYVSEIVALKEAQFRVRSIGRKCVVLEGIPGAYVVEAVRREHGGK